MKANNNKNIESGPVISFPVYRKKIKAGRSVIKSAVHSIRLPLGRDGNPGSKRFERRFKSSVRKWARPSLIRI